MSSSGKSVVRVVGGAVGGCDSVGTVRLVVTVLIVVDLTSYSTSNGSPIRGSISACLLRGACKTEDIACRRGGSSGLGLDRLPTVDLSRTSRVLSILQGRASTRRRLSVRATAGKRRA